MLTVSKVTEEDFVSLFKNGADRKAGDVCARLIYAHIKATGEAEKLEIVDAQKWVDDNFRYTSIAVALLKFNAETADEVLLKAHAWLLDDGMILFRSPPDIVVKSVFGISLKLNHEGKWRATATEHPEFSFVGDDQDEAIDGLEELVNNCIESGIKIYKD